MKTRFRIFIPGIKEAELAYLKSYNCEHVYLYNIWLKSVI